MPFVLVFKETQLDDLDMTRQIFSQVKFSISTSLPAQRQNELKELLKANGASLVDVAEATHIISNTLQFEGNERATDSVNIVTVRHRYFVSSKKALT